MTKLLNRTNYFTPSLSFRAQRTDIYPIVWAHLYGLLLLIYLQGAVNKLLPSAKYEVNPSASPIKKTEAEKNN